MSDGSVSWASSDGVARSMRSNRRKHTRPELRIRRLLHSHEYRYRVDFAPDPAQRRSRADIVFTRARVAVFVDGCFWHGCPIHATMPSTNRDYWEPKLLRNRERDDETNARLEALGWRVIRTWEHEDPITATATIESAVDGARRRSEPGPA